MALTEAEKYERRLQREIETLEHKKAIKSYAHVLDLCAATFQKLRVIESADKDGIVVCVTCGKIMMHSDKNAQGGHFIPRHHTAALFDPVNVNVQCGYVCNGIGGGKPTEYETWLAQTYGPYEVERLKALKKSRKYEIEELAAMRVEWLRKIRIEQKRIN